MYIKPYLKHINQPLTHTLFPDRIAFILEEDIATWHATSFNAASEEANLGLLGLTPSFLRQPTAPQWQS